MKRYKVADLQIAGRYFWEGHLFDCKAEIVNGLLDYHDIDFTGTDDKENELDIWDYLEFYKFNTVQKKLDWVLEYGDWEVEKVECSICPDCKEIYETSEGKHYGCEIEK